MKRLASAADVDHHLTDRPGCDPAGDLTDRRLDPGFGPPSL